MPVSATAPASTPPAVSSPDRYHRMLRHHRGRALGIVGLTVVLYALLFLVMLVAVEAAGQRWPAFDGAIDRAAESIAIDVTDPVMGAITFGGVALMLPATLGAAAILGQRGVVSSVAKRFRWGLLARATLPSLALVSLSVMVTAAHTWSDRAPSEFTPLAAVVILTLIPVQAAAEEYVFRGVLPQAVGAWLRSPVWGVLISLPLFTIGHEYDLPGLLSIAVFAAASAYIVWRTGGLEVVVAWHWLNNTLVFVLAIVGFPALETAVPVSVALMDIAVSALMVATVEVLWRRDWSARYDSRGRTTPLTQDRPGSDGTIGM